MKRFRSFAHKLLLVLAVVTVSVVFEGCSEVADKTIHGMKGLPIPTIPMRTAKPAEMEIPDTVAKYNYIYFHNNSEWVTDELVSYKVVDGGRNIEFTAKDSSDNIIDCYTSMANVILIHKDESACAKN